jgi:RNA polymerase sigma-70 factor (ECF subfamily)
MSREVTALFPSQPSLRHGLDPLLPALYARALKLCGNSSDAQDLLQDTVVRALRFESTFERGTNLKAWLYQILMSVFVSRCRRLRRERRALEWLSADPCAWTRHEAPAAMTKLSTPVERALKTLPAKFARVLELVDIEERSYREAAEELGLPIGTVMSRLFRGRRMLAAALAEPELPVAA